MRNSGFWVDLDGFGGVEDTMWSHLPHESAFNLMRTCKSLHNSGKSQGRMLQFEPVARRHDHVASEAVDLRDEMHLNGEDSDDGEGEGSEDDGKGEESNEDIDSNDKGNDGDDDTKIKPNLKDTKEKDRGTNTHGQATKQATTINSPSQRLRACRTLR